MYLSYYTLLQILNSEKIPIYYFLTTVVIAIIYLFYFLKRHISVRNGSKFVIGFVDAFRTFPKKGLGIPVPEFCHRKIRARPITSPSFFQNPYVHYSLKIPTVKKSLFPLTFFCI